MNKFTLPTRVLKTTKTIIDHYLPVECIEFVVDDQGVEIILVKVNTLTLRWKIQKVSIRHFKVTQKIISIMEVNDFMSIFNYEKLKYLTFKQENQQIEVLDKKTSLEKFKTHEIPQQFITLPLNQDKHIQINLKQDVFQKIISEYQFTNQDVEIEIQKNQIRIQKDNKLIAKFQSESSQIQSIKLCKSAFSIIDNIIQTQRQKNQIQLSLYQDSIQQLRYNNDFIEANILFHSKYIEKPKFNSFIIENGRSFLNILKKFNQLISNTPVFSVTQELFKINQMDNSQASMVYFEIGKDQLEQFTFEQVMCESFAIAPIIDKFKSNKIINLQIKINSTNLIVIDTETQQKVELLKTNDNQHYFPEKTPPETIIQIKRSQLLAVQNEFTTNKNITICVLKEQVIVKKDKLELIKDINIIQHNKKKKNLIFNSRYIKLFLDLTNDKKEEEIICYLIQNLPIVFKQKIADSWIITMYLSPLIKK